MAATLRAGTGRPRGPSGLTYIRPTVLEGSQEEWGVSYLEPRGSLHDPWTLQGAAACCPGVGPRSRLSLPSTASLRPPQKPNMGTPMVSRATLPARTIRSDQDKFAPCLRGYVSVAHYQDCNLNSLCTKQVELDKQIKVAYLSLMGHRRRKALSKFVLSSQLRSGSNLILPPSAPPRPSDLLVHFSNLTSLYMYKSLKILLILVVRNP